MEEQKLKRQAVILHALGLCRGLLYSVRAGDIDVPEIDRILAETSLEHLAEILGLSEDDLACDDLDCGGAACDEPAADS
jgi:hypothetical protein